MEIYSVRNLSFTYPNRKDKAVKNINLSVNTGDFILLCGKSGCGKTTLLRLLKSALAPFGKLEGEVVYKGKLLAETETKIQSKEIGFVLQNPDNQIATDKVWHELAFGPESLGMNTMEIRTKVSEMASFFGIQNWFYQKTSELSGGQKQLLNLASVMVMQPEVLILDEPTSLLDPIAASKFLKTLKKINEELGTTIILTEHRAEEVFSLVDRVIVLDNGEVVADDTPTNTGKRLSELNHCMCDALPVPMRVFSQLEDCRKYPLTVRDGRVQLLEYAQTHSVDKSLIPKAEEPIKTDAVIEVKNVFFRYEKNLPDVIKDLNLTVNKGEFFALLGGNGTGKTTAVSVIAGLNTPQRGAVYINGSKLLKNDDLYKGIIGVLPQNPQSLFAGKTVYYDLMDMTDKKSSKDEREIQTKKIAALCKIDDLLESHPYDLSGGEQQRVALAMVLLLRPRILIMDEPTKGMDVHFKRIFAGILQELKNKGITIFMVSHDIEFCAEYADRCAMFFDGSITSMGAPRCFFSGNNFYTTSANRMARNLLPDAILAEDIILAFKGRVKPRPPMSQLIHFPEDKQKGSNSKPGRKRFLPFILTLILFVGVLFLQNISTSFQDGQKFILQALSILMTAVGVGCLFPQSVLKKDRIQVNRRDNKLNKRTLVSVMMLLIAVPLTICFGIYFLEDRKYYFISLIIILETMFSFCMMFENRKPQAREIVVISVLCAVAVAGRTAFFMLPEFKPVAAIVIISGICFGGETGFLVGSISGFVSNFVFGQGPWTPWQMFAFGIIGFVAGLVFKNGGIFKTRFSLTVFGFLSTLIIYGGIMNTASVLMMSGTVTLSMLKSAYMVGLPIDMIHALSTAFFLWFISEPMIEKLERIKIKYGLIEAGDVN